MNGTTDESYRYKMPQFNISICGKGNGIYTIFNNIDEICNSITHPKEVFMTYLATINGSNYIQTKNIINGTFTQEKLIEDTLEYIKHLVMCPKCNIPETKPKIIGNKKNIQLILTCSACNNDSILYPINKRIDKGIDIIIKYIKSEKDWSIKKGYVVKQDDFMQPF